MDMINRLHMEMIRFDAGDPARIQHNGKVHAYAKLIGECEGLDADTLFTLETAALTHDIAIHLCQQKYGSDAGKLQEQEGPALADEMLPRLGFDSAVVDRVKYLIAHHHTYKNIDGIDYRILVEADFLVNLLENGSSRESCAAAYREIFRTETGRTICREMYGIEE